MADLTITAASVVKGSNAVVDNGTAGASITAGQAVYKDAATGTYKLADADSGTAAARQAVGVALHAAASGQPLQVQTKGQITIGATVAVGTAYCASATAGGVCPNADLTTGAYPTFLGFAISATVIDLNPVYAGVAKP